MADAVDRVFVKAISTIKALSLRKGPGSLPQPPVENRIRLYGLYKQATGELRFSCKFWAVGSDNIGGLEGDVEGIMIRPRGRTPEDQAGKRKWYKKHVDEDIY